MFHAAENPIAFTGAGISTESGLPDFRSPNGLWSRRNVVPYRDFLQSEDVRREYWRMRRAGYPRIRDAQPNAGHIALAGMEAAGRLRAIITQNIDGLHQRAGSRRVLELHGTAHAVVCLSCAARFDPDTIQERLEAGEEIPACAACGGLLKSAAVSFGEPMPRAVLEEAAELSASADLMLIVGSSLAVEPAASLPRLAARNGACLAIINASPAALDERAELVVREPAGAVLSEMARLVAASTSPAAAVSP